METPWAKLLQPVAGYGPPDPESALCYNATEPDAQAYDELEPSASQWPTGLRPADISQAFSMVPIYAELPAPAQQQDAGGASDPATPPPSSPAAAAAAAWQAADAAYAWRAADAPSVQQPLAISAAAPDEPPTPSLPPTPLPTGYFMSASGGVPLAPPAQQYRQPPARVLPHDAEPATAYGGEAAPAFAAHDATSPFTYDALPPSDDADKAYSARASSRLRLR